MTPPNKFTRRQEQKIYEVGRKIEQARLAMRLSVRGAADRTITSSQTGHMTEATWRRVERGYIQTRLGHILYRPTPESLVAMAEVVGLDGDELCRELELKPPPQRVNRTNPKPAREAVEKRIEAISSELEELRRAIRELQ